MSSDVIEDPGITCTQGGVGAPRINQRLGIGGEMVCGDRNLPQVVLMSNKTHRAHREYPRIEFDLEE